MAVSGLVCNLNLAELEAQDRYDALLQGTFLIVMMTGSPGALRAPTSSWMPFGPLDIVICALRALRPVRRARLRSGHFLVNVFSSSKLGIFLKIVHFIIIFLWI